MVGVCGCDVLVHGWVGVCCSFEVHHWVITLTSQDRGPTQLHAQNLMAMNACTPTCRLELCTHTTITADSTALAQPSILPVVLVTHNRTTILRQSAAVTPRAAESAHCGIAVAVALSAHCRMHGSPVQGCRGCAPPDVSTDKNLLLLDMQAAPSQPNTVSTGPTRTSHLKKQENITPKSRQPL